MPKINKNMMKTYKTQLKRFTRIIAWLLLLTIAANFLNIFIAPKVAHAATQVAYPSGDISAINTWAVFPTSPTTKFDKVDEVGANDGDTTYLTHGTTAGNALFSFPAFSIPAGSTIADLTVTVVARDVSSGKNAVQPAIRVNSVNYLTISTSTEVPAAYTAISYAYTTNPNTTAAWTVADINGTGASPLMYFGVSSADASPAFRITQVYATVNYTNMTISTNKGSYPTSGEWIDAYGTVYNNTTGDLSATVIDYVIFIDTNGDHIPTAGETYVTANCAGSGAWAAGSYTFRTSYLLVNAGTSFVDNRSCANTNFPSNTTYTIWSQWYNGATIYATAYTTFSSVPTLGEILFLVLIGCAVFIGVKSGVIKLKPTKEPKDCRGLRPRNDNSRVNKQANIRHQIRSIDGIRKIPKKDA